MDRDEVEQVAGRVDGNGTTARPPLLEVSGATKRFGAVEALVDVDLVVHRHEVVALVGDNAAGKSTLARMVAGVHQPDAGTVRLEGVDVALASPSQAYQAGVATVFQELALADNLDVTANIFLGRELRVGRLLDEARMEHLAHDYLQQLNSRIPSPRVRLSTLSAGQRQCVAIARTLVGDPRLIVLDEPTASLSVAQTAEVLNHVSSLRDLGLGVVLISHNLTDVRAVADRVEVLRHGRNNGSFDAESPYESVIAAITGATMVQRRR
ncbi:ATP-binding cassette domain-containing protein [Litorihabitans aurantiacus]|uniref:ATP-binding cassette domain-containing protein n=1 Tax=Litorihabitans aurantiacus TaxID=1930061 RepID=UPI0024E16CB1|nr:ATP-binding cassette domain-containing protein [Litorihabitans aurantiacus]